MAKKIIEDYTYTKEELKHIVSFYKKECSENMCNSANFSMDKHPHF